jgi:hypothetical protein
MKKYFNFTQSVVSRTLRRHFVTINSTNLSYNVPNKYTDFINQFNFRKKELEDNNSYLASYNRIMKEHPMRWNHIDNNIDSIEFKGKRIDVGKGGLIDFIDKDANINSLKELLNTVKTFEQARVIINKYLEIINKEDVSTELYLKEENFLFKIIILYSSKSDVIKNFLEDAISLVIQQYGENSVEALKIYLLLSHLDYNHGNFNNGLRYAQKSLDIFTNLPGKDDIRKADALVALSLNNVNNINQQVSYLEEAYGLYTREGGDKLKEPQIYYKAICSYQLGCIYYLLKEEKQALVYFESSLLEEHCVASDHQNMDVQSKVGEISLNNGYVQKSYKAYSNILITEHGLGIHSKYYHAAVKGIINLIENFDLKLDDLSTVQQVQIYLDIIEYCINFDSFKLGKFISIVGGIVKTYPSIKKEHPEIISKFHLLETQANIKLLNFDDAQSSLAKYASLNKTDTVFSNFEIGRFNIYLNKPGKAIEHFELAIKSLDSDKTLKERYQDNYNTLNLLLTHGYLLQGNRKKAIDLLKNLSNTDDMKVKSTSDKLLRFILSHNKE